MQEISPLANFLSAQNHQEPFPLSPEGQLSVDVIETKESIIVQAAVAGVKEKDIDIHVTPEMITIRGSRKQTYAAQDAIEEGAVHVQECFWGIFSRSVLLPSSVLPSATHATLTDGVLTIRLKKVEMESTILVTCIDE